MLPLETAALAGLLLVSWTVLLLLTIQLGDMVFGTGTVSSSRRLWMVTRWKSRIIGWTSIHGNSHVMTLPSTFSSMARSTGTRELIVSTPRSSTELISMKRR